MRSPSSSGHCYTTTGASGTQTCMPTGPHISAPRSAICALDARSISSSGSSTRRTVGLSPEQWYQPWRELQRWVEERPPAMLAVPNIMSEQQQNQNPFPTVLFSHNSAISGNQLYHTACILMLEIRPPGFTTAQAISAPESFPVWHARRICGISCTNPHKGSRIEAIQPLYIAGRLFTHVSERMEIARLPGPSAEIRAGAPGGGCEIWRRSGDVSTTSLTASSQPDQSSRVSMSVST